MSTDDFMKQQFITLRDEIRESKARIFWLMIIGMLLVMASGYLAAEYPNAFANAAIPFLLIGLMLSFVSEQNNIARAGRYLRESVEPRVQEQGPGARHGAHWHASQDSGFSREQATASTASIATVACWMRVAGRERR